MPDGLTVSGSAALNALRAELGDAVPIFGGTAGDQWRFKGTRQFHGTEVLQDSVPFLLFGEGVVFSFGVDTGWRPIGREGRVSDVDRPRGAGHRWPARDRVLPGVPGQRRHHAPDGVSTGGIGR